MATRTASLILSFAVLVCAALTTGQHAYAEPDAGSAARDVVTRRLSPEQYRQIVTDIFGPGIKIGGRFEPEAREGGLLAIGAGRASVTASGLEQYDGMARTIAAQVVDEEHRGVLIPCKPVSATEPDADCAGRFIASAGRLMYRRALTAEELKARVALAGTAATATKSFYNGLATSLADMLVSPQFLFWEQSSEPDPDRPGQYRLDAYSKASQLSFLLWNAAPDSRLLAAAESGDLNTKSGLTKQVDRLLASPRLESGVRAFFVDMLGFDQFASLSKDATIYPKFNAQASREAKEQTLRTIVDQVLTRRGDYRDLFTTRRTFLTRTLGAIYGVPVVKTTPNDAPDDWQEFEYPAGDPRAGILMQASFVALHAHPGRSSPTIRGKALREVVLCQKVPDPPGNVNFTVVQDTKNPMFKTARDRVTAHRTEPACAGCHKLIDPMGLAMENFDGGGSFRTTENGAAIDASGDLDGVKFSGPAGLGQAVHDSPAAPSCLVNRLSSYALGRTPTKAEIDWINGLGKDFAADGYKVPDLLRRVALSDELYRVAPPRTGAIDMAVPKLASEIHPSQERTQ